MTKIYNFRQRFLNLLEKTCFATTGMIPSDLDTVTLMVVYIPLTLCMLRLGYLVIKQYKKNLNTNIRHVNTDPLETTHPIALPPLQSGAKIKPSVTVPKPEWYVKLETKWVRQPEVAGFVAMVASKKPWFLSVNNNEIMSSYAMPEFSNNVLELMNALPENVSIDTFFCLALLDSAKTLLKEGYNAADVIMIYYLLFPHSNNVNNLVHVAAKIKVFKKLRHVNVMNTLSENNQNLVKSPKYLEDCNIRDFTKIGEELVMHKVNKNLENPLVIRTGKESMTGAFNLSGNQNPDYRIILKDFFYGYTQYMIDCKATHRDIGSLNTLRLTHNEEQLLTLAQRTHKILISALESMSEININIHEKDVVLYVEELKQNLQDFENTGDMEAFLGKFITLHGKNLHLLMSIRLGVSITEMLNINDLDNQRLAETKKAFLEHLSRQFKVDSILYKRVVFYSANYESIPTVQHRFTIDVLDF